MSRVREVEFAGAETESGDDGSLVVSSREAEVHVIEQGDTVVAEITRLTQSLPKDERNLFLRLLQEHKDGKSKLRLNKKGDIVVHNIAEESIPENTMKFANISVKEKEKQMAEIKKFLDLVEEIQRTRSAGGLVVGKDGVSLSATKTYEEGKDYTQIETLGTGLNAKVTLVRDNVTDKSMAKKAVTINGFNCNEIQAMFELESLNFTPKLHAFKIEKYMIHIFMEAIESALTMKSVINQLANEVSLTPQDKLSFAVYFLIEAMESIKKMHSIGWLHRDLHWENVMLRLKQQETTTATSIGINVGVIIIDFGTTISTKELYNRPPREKLESHVSDLQNLLRQFCAIALCGNLCTCAFDDSMDFKNRYASILLEEISTEVPEELKRVVLEIVERGFQVKHLVKEEDFIDFVRSLPITDRERVQKVLGKLSFEKPIHDVQNVVASSSLMQQDFTNVRQSERMQNINQAIHDLNVSSS